MADRRGNSVERYYASKQKRRKSRKVRLYVFLTLFCMVTFIVLSLTVFFNIRSFQVQGNITYSKNQIIQATGLVEGDNLFRLNKFKIADTMTQQLPYISSVEIYRKLPTTLCIDVQETGAAYVAYHNAGYVLMNSSFKVLEIKSELPEDVAYLIGVTLTEATPGKTAVFEKETTIPLLTTLTAALEQHFDFGKVSALDVTESYNLRLYYDNHRVKILLGNADLLSDKLQMAENTIAQNGVREHARIDITTSQAAYYRILDEEEIDDVVGILHGTAEPHADKTYEKPAENPEEGDQGTDSDEDETENTSES